MYVIDHTDREGVVIQQVKGQSLITVRQGGCYLQYIVFNIHFYKVVRGQVH